MTEETKTETTETKSEAPKQGRPAKPVKISNKSQRLITLITRADRVRIVPTKEVEVSKDFMAEIRKNKAAMAYFDRGDLVEV